MGNFHYFMPTDCYFGRGCVAEHKAAMAKLGKKAMVVTGKTSAKRNGAQQDITDALDEKLDLLGNLSSMAGYLKRDAVLTELNAYYRSLGVTEEELIQPDRPTSTTRSPTRPR